MVLSEYIRSDADRLAEDRRQMVLSEYIGSNADRLAESGW